MSDVDHNLLYDLAEAQAGYFTAAQVLSAGMDRSTLRYHARPGGRYERVGHGIYRLRHFPSSPHEQVVAAWLPLAGVQAVVSHVSALELHDLSDVIPDAVHVSVSRTKRGIRPREGVRIHTLETPLEPGEITHLTGVPVTRVERTLFDSLDDGAQPDLVEQAARQALSRGLTTQKRLRDAAHGRRSRRVNDLINTLVDLERRR